MYPQPSRGRAAGTQSQNKYPGASFPFPCEGPTFAGRSYHGRRSYSYIPGMDRGEHGGDSGVRGKVKMEASGDVDAARGSSA